VGHDTVETESLLRRAGEGDDHAAQEVLMKHRERLRRMVAVRMDPRLARRLDPSDVIQETMAEASRRLPEYIGRRDCAFYPWLRGLAWERLIELHRRHIDAQCRSVKREERREMRMSNASTMILADRLAASDTSPSGRMLREELRDRVQRALDQLAPLDREIVTLRHLEQLSFREAADVIGVTEAAAQSRYRRAAERLHELLSDGSEGAR
jgi:RNA polymerase sigma-70 factor (ECF subfamily)